jgi:hypothetical protein
MHSDPPTGIGLIALLLCAVVGLGISVVDRSTAMRELRVEYEHLQVMRDSLTTANLRSRLDLVAAIRPDKVYRWLTDRGFTVPSHSRLRFLIYPKAIPEAKGNLTARLSELVVTKEHDPHSTRTRLDRLADVPQRHSTTADSGWSDAG